MQKYNPKKIEKKWQKRWDEEKLYKAEDFSKKPKKYILVEFPYPSGAGLHVGHVRSYAALDTVARKSRMNGKNVLFPMGWDAYGLPTENYAIKHKIHPVKATKANVATFKKQLKSLGLSFDWSREINTTDPEYYKWTQWIFLQLYKKGLAYKKKMPINWCSNCKIGLAHEEVIDGKCERCGEQTEQKEKVQWMLAITKYAEKLINDLESVDYLDKIKTQQVNWIGKSEGSEIEFKVKNSKFGIKVFTTRADTLYGATYMVLAPEHSMIEKIKNKIKNWDEVTNYIKNAKTKSDLERTELQKEKSGVEIKGVKAVNPVNNEEIPIYIADYVLSSYGTGAIMAVPAHDERDFEFAKKYNIPIKQVIVPFLKTNFEKDLPRVDKETIKRNNVIVIIKHWEEDKYYCLDWVKYGWKSFVIGGVEDNESIKEAAIREMKEESGYQNIKSIKKLGGKISTKFYAFHKGINRDTDLEGYYVELKDGEFVEPEAKHVEHHKGEWVSKEKLSDFINLNSHEWYMNEFLKRGCVFDGMGKLTNSNEFDGMRSSEAKRKIIEKVNGKITTNYKLRDWVFSRQHYWGEPIPMINCEKCGWLPVSEDKLPVKLPEVENYEPTNTGESPLAAIEDWVNTKCPKCRGEAKRETDTMPNWAGSSWYFLRYIDPKNNKEFADQKKLKYWMPVDLYNGGMEHTTLHLLYSRFWNKFLHEIGVVPVSEPYARRRSHGMVLASDNRKMSKSFGNVINPDEIVNDNKNGGADTLRMYEMFMGPFGEAIPWNEDGVKGLRRFLEKCWRVYNEKELIDCRGECKGISEEIPRLLNKTIKKVTKDINSFDFNTAISQMMIFMNEVLKYEKLPIEAMKKFLTILSPFAPHIAEELWEKLGNKASIFKEKWPEYNEELLKNDSFELIIQVNGKVRDKIRVKSGISEVEALKIAKKSDKVNKYLDGCNIAKVIMVKNRLLNIVAVGLDI